MASTSTIKILTLHGKGLKLNTREDIDPYLKDIDPTLLEEVHLGGNTIGVGAAQVLAEFLAKTQVLKVRSNLINYRFISTLRSKKKKQPMSPQVADFADIFTGRLISEIPQALSAICDALKDKSSLVEINLSDNAFGGRSVDPMVPLLTHNRSIQILRLNNNGLGPAGGQVIAKALLASAKLSKAEGKKSNLKTVICGRNRLENGSASEWAEAFAEHGTLVEVRMVQNGIRVDGITALARGLAKCPDIEYIDLQDNTFTVDGELTGVEAWAEALASWPNLHTLNFSDCVLSAEGEVPEIINALSLGSNPNLHSLHLQNNNLETRTFEVLAGAVSKGIQKLMTLALQWNDIEEDDENLENISLTLKKRGGKLFISDEDEEEEEEEEKEQEKEEEKEEGGEKEAEAIKVDETPIGQKQPDTSADALADLFSKVAIQA